MLASVVAELHATARANHTLYCIAVSGCGCSGVAALTSVPGASASLLAAAQPYSREAFVEAVAGRVMEGVGFGSAASAHALARASLAHAKLLVNSRPAAERFGMRLVGIGMAGALSSIPPRRGANAVHFAAVDDATCSAASLCLAGGETPPPTRSRADEEALAGLLLLAGLSTAVRGEAGARGLAPLFTALVYADPRGQLRLGGDESLDTSYRRLGDPIDRLLGGMGGDANSAEAASYATYTRYQRVVGGGGAAAMSPGPATEAAAEAAAADVTTHVRFTPRPPPPPPAVAQASDGVVPPSSLPRPTAATTSTVVNAPIGRETLVVPGSFNPLHCGHTRLAAAAMRKLGGGGVLTPGAGADSSAADGTAPPTPLSCEPEDYPLSTSSGAGGGSGRGNSTRRMTPPPSRVVFELSAANVDKPPLPRGTIVRRVAQFVSVDPTTGEDVPTAGHPPVSPYPIVVTNAPRFVDKAALFPGAAFAIGYDTAARLVEPRYYGGDAAAMELQLLRLALGGTRFVVAGRVEGAVAPALPPGSSSSSSSGSSGSSSRSMSVAPSPRFLTLDDLLPAIPPLLVRSGLFVGLTEEEFREDVSSTELRAAAAVVGIALSHNVR